LNHIPQQGLGPFAIDGKVVINEKDVDQSIVLLGHR
jgi:hypothetical protein